MFNHTWPVLWTWIDVISSRSTRFTSSTVSSSQVSLPTVSRPLQADIDWRLFHVSRVLWTVDRVPRMAWRFDRKLDRPRPGLVNNTLLLPRRTIKRFDYRSTHSVPSTYDLVISVRSWEDVLISINEAHVYERTKSLLIEFMLAIFYWHLLIRKNWVFKLINGSCVSYVILWWFNEINLVCCSWLNRKLKNTSS